MYLEREVQKRVCARCGYGGNEVSRPWCESCGDSLWGSEIVGHKVEMEVELADLSQRFAAAAIDLAMVLVWAVLIGFVLLRYQFSIFSVSFCSILYGFEVLYSVAFWVGRNGRTPGKAAVGIRVIGADGGPTSVWTAIVRAVGYALSALPGGMGFLAIAFDERKRGWHDQLAGTYVIVQKGDERAGSS